DPVPGVNWPSPVKSRLIVVEWSGAFIFVAPCGLSPPLAPPAQFGPELSQISTVIKLGKFVSVKVLKAAGVAVPVTLVASGCVLNPSAVARMLDQSDVLSEPCGVVLVKRMSNFNSVPLLENTKFSKVAVALRLAVVPPAVVALKFTVKFSVLPKLQLST